MQNLGPNVLLISVKIRTLIYKHKAAALEMWSGMVTQAIKYRIPHKIILQPVIYVTAYRSTDIPGSGNTAQKSQ